MSRSASWSDGLAFPAPAPDEPFWARLERAWPHWHEFDWAPALDSAPELVQCSDAGRPLSHAEALEAAGIRHPVT